MQINDAEKLILAMLCDIHTHLKIEGEIDPKLVQSALYNDHTWGLMWAYPSLYEGRSEKPAAVKEVVEILDMWSQIETYYGRLSAEDKATIKTEALPYGAEVKFPGFDGNDELECSYMSIAEFLIKDLRRFTNFTDRDLNSHDEMLDSYRKMLEVFRPMRLHIPDSPITAAELISLLKLR